MSMERRVLVAGWGQIKQEKELQGKPKDPLGLMFAASKQAAEQTVSDTVLNHVDGIMVVRTVSRHYDDPGARLAKALGITPKFTFVSDIGGNSPQTLVNIAAGKIARKELDCVLIAGAEAYVPRGNTDRPVENALFRGVPADYQGDDFKGATQLEIAHGMKYPMHGFPLFETALWAASGLERDSYLEKVAEMWSEFSRVAAGNPYAWSRTVRSPRQIIERSPENRPVAFPYTKYMNSFVTVDQGAAVILMAEEKAEQCRNRELKPVYFLGGGFACDRQRFMIEKSDFTASPPLRAAVDKALDRSDMTLDRIECFDLYSCFPSAVSIAKKMIGIRDDDKRPLTLTGGLGFFGGPGNNYSLHSIATLAQQIACGRKKNGMITALGWFMHKHAVGIYSDTPNRGYSADHDIQDQENPLAGSLPEKIKAKADGKGFIETYTVVYGPDQEPKYVVIYGKTDDGFRFVGKTESPLNVFGVLTSTNQVGRGVELSFDPVEKINRVRLL